MVSWNKDYGKKDIELIAEYYKECLTEKQFNLNLLTMKKKFFVLRSTSSSGPARLEYYDSEKKFNAGTLPKKSIELHTCFNINKNCDTKHKNAIALYTKEHCFSIIAEDADKQTAWLNLLKEFQNDFTPMSSKQHYDYIWTVSIKDRGLGKVKGMTGHFRFSLTEDMLDLVRVGSEEPSCTIRLSEIRRCGHSDNYFFMEVGRSAVTGDGEFWMQTDDKDISQNMHEVTLSSMKIMATAPVNHRQSHCLLLGNDNEQINPASDSWHQRSPSRSISDNRPSSAINVVYQCPNPLLQDTATATPSLLGFSPVSSIEFVSPTDIMRPRTDSNGSKGSKSSHSVVSVEDDPILNHTGYRSHGSITPELGKKSLNDESDGYLMMGPGHKSSTPSPTRQRPERPGSSGSDSRESGVRCDSYMAMNPNSSVGSGGNDSGYMDMLAGPTVSCSAVGIGSSLPSNHKEMVHMIGPGMASSAPIAIRSSKEPSYIDMGQHLPTVKEGGSGEAYLPMSPHQQSPKVTANLRPDRVISYLSDDSMSGEFPTKRAYSVGSRPVQTHRSHLIGDIRQPVLDNGRSSSAPHLIVQKSRSPHVNDSSLSASPLSYSLRSDDSDSFMEMDFCRPRTGSDSYGCRPRSSSFGKVFAQGHRPRSSSYGQAARLKLSFFESVRTTSTELLRRRSQDSVRKSSPLSSKASSTESLRKLSEEWSSQKSEYVDMNVGDKSNTQSSKAQNSKPVGEESNSYVDMTFRGPPKHNGSNSSCNSSTKLGTSSSPAITAGHRKLEMRQLESKDMKLSPRSIQKPSTITSVREKHGVGLHGQHDMDPAGKDKKLGMSVGYVNYGTEEHEKRMQEAEFMPQLMGNTVGKKSPSGSSHESEDESYVPFKPDFPRSKQNYPGTSAILTKTELSNVHHQTKSHLEEHDEKMFYRGSGDSIKHKTSQSDKLVESDSAELLTSTNNTYLLFDPEPSKKWTAHSPETSASRIETSVTVPARIPTKCEMQLEVVTTANYITFDPIFKPAAYSCGIDTKAPFSLKPHTVQSFSLKKSEQKNLKVGTGSAEQIVGKYKHKTKKQSSKSRNKGSKDCVTEEEVYIPYQIAEKSEKKTSAAKDVVENKRDIVYEVDGKPERFVDKGDDGYVDLDIFAEVQKPMKLFPLLKVESVISDNKTSCDGKNMNEHSCHSSGDKMNPLVEIVVSENRSELREQSGIRSRSSTDSIIDAIGNKEDSVPQKHLTGVCVVGAENGWQPRSRQFSGNSTSSKNGDSHLRKSGCLLSLEKNGDSELCKTDTLTTPVTALFKQNSLPCITPPVDDGNGGNSQHVRVFDNNPRSRHSFTDISVAYERMSFPSNSISSQQTTSAQQLCASHDGNKKLNYASLDLGSGDSVDQRDPYSTQLRSRHSSTIEDTGPPSSYAQIDFKKSECLRNSGNKDVKFTL